MTKVLFRDQIDLSLFSESLCHPSNLAKAKARMIENSVKTSASTTCDPPRRILQCAMIGATEKAVPALTSAANQQILCRLSDKTGKRVWVFFNT